MKISPILTLCLLLLPVGSISGEAVRSSDWRETILDRYREILLNDGVHRTDQLRAYVQGLTEDGLWPDIRYDDPSPTGWSANSHISRLQSMAHAYNHPDHPLFRDKAMLGKIHLGLDHWIEKRYQCTNWWYNEIGVPRGMRDVAILMLDHLEGERLAGVLGVIGQHSVRGIGANLTWSAELGIHHSCLANNWDKAREYAQRVWDEVTVGAEEGIQPDWSFYQHAERLQTFHYGLSYLDSVIKLSWQLRGTEMAMPDYRKHILSTYLLEGPQWMSRGTQTAPGTLDRAVSRRRTLGAANLIELLKLWREVDEDRQDEINLFIGRQDGTAPLLTGYRHFPYADFTVYHRPDAAYFLKTLSSRTHLTESINKENLKGVPYLNCGDHYVIRDGTEYGDMPPVWEWNRLPGLTIAGEESNQQRNEFVGGVGNGHSGLTAMDYVRSVNEETAVSVRKSWFFHDDAVVCLLGGWKGPAASQAVTSLEQSRLQGPVLMSTKKGGTEALNPGSHTLQGVKWILHNGIGYLPLNNCRLRVFMGPREGSWYAINHAQSGEPVSEEVFELLMENRGDTLASGYVIILGADVDKLEALAKRPSWHVLRNDKDLQALRFGRDLFMSSFFAPGRVGTQGGLAVDQPCLAIWSAGGLWMSDPTFKGRRVSLQWQGQSREVHLRENGDTHFVAKSSTDPEDLYLHETFDGSLDSGLAGALLANPYIRLAEGGGPDGSNAIRAAYVGFPQGSQRIVLTYPLGMRSTGATLSFDVFFENDFQFVRGGKLHGLGPEKRVAGGQAQRPDGWSSRIMWRTGGHAQTYLYDQSPDTVYGIGQSSKDPVFRTGQWHRVVLQTRLNDPGKANGLARVLVDGHEVLSTENVEFRGEDGPHAEIQAFLFSTFHGGNSPIWAPIDENGEPVTVHARFDNFIVREGLHENPALSGP